MRKAHDKATCPMCLIMAGKPDPLDDAIALEQAIRVLRRRFPEERALVRELEIVVAGLRGRAGEAGGEAGHGQGIT